MNTLRTAIIAAALLISGCASTGFATSGGRNAELVWQGMHLMDTMQTVTIARSPDCLYEKSPLAQKVYGAKHPSVERVLVTNAAGAALHWVAGAWVDRMADRAMASERDSTALWYVARGLYYGASFAGTGSAVIGNWRLGVKPLSRVRCTP